LKRIRLLLLLCFLTFLTSCGQVGKQGELENVGLLVPETIMDQGWGSTAYRGILRIQSLYNVDVYYKEGMNIKLIVERAIEELDQKGVNLIFGHGHEYAEYFSDISLKSPDIHFI
jgi:transcriptional activator of comK gene